MKTQCCITETKSEARSSKFETNPNKQNSNDPNKLKIETGKMLKKISGSRTLFVQSSLTHVVVLLLVFALCLSGCAGKSASSKFYVLSSLPQSALSATEGTTIGVLPVAMPDYLDRPQIVTRASENEIKIDEFSRWAEPLKESFTRALVQNLSSLLDTAKVIKTTGSTGYPMALQVGVEVVQFDGTLGGDIVLIVKWGLFGEGGKKLLIAKRSSFKEPTGAATYEALVAAQSKTVAALSREIAETIKTKK
jgi:uncharacterized lipoprotein YmbA